MIERLGNAIGPFDPELAGDEPAGPNTVLEGWVLIACWRDLDAEDDADPEWTTRLDSSTMPRTRRRGLLYEALKQE